HGGRLNQMGKSVEKFASQHGLTIVRNVGGHGVGRSLHEEPGFIANFFDARDKRAFKENSVVAIEPIVSTGAQFLQEAADGWSLYHPKFLTAQSEHTVMVTNSKPFIFTKPTVDVA
ncbi:MAG: M24 family metallopeptidase, partial [Pseudomonadota bacterium]